MKRNSLTYRITAILCGIFMIPYGMSSLCAQDVHIVNNSIYHNDKDSTEHITVKNDSLTNVYLTNDSVTNDSIVIAPGDSIGKYNEALDSTLIGLQADSLMRNVPFAREQFIPDPQRALWLSLVIPGAGQVYNRKLWKIPIVYGGFLGCLYALTWNNQMYSDYSQAYLDIMDDDPNTKSYVNMLPINFDITGREEQYKEIFKNKKNYYRKYRDMSIFAMVGVYLLSVIDAYVDAQLSTFDISPDLGLKVEPVIFKSGKSMENSSVGLQCKLNF